MAVQKILSQQIANTGGTAGQVLVANSTGVTWGDANNATNLGGVAAANYQTTAGLSSNVATLTANNTSFVGSVSAANVVSNAQLSSNLANYQTTAGLSANVSFLTANGATYLNGKTESNLNVNSALTSNTTSFVGSVSAANVVSNSQLSSNLANYQTTAGLSANVATLTSNSTSYVGAVSAANVVSNAQLSSNLSNYQTTAGLSANVSFLTANGATYLNGKTESNLNVNNALYLGSVAAASYVNTSGAYTLTGVQTYNANVVIGPLGELVFNANAGIYANGSLGTSGQVLTSNATTVYWSTVSGGGGFTNGQSISVANLVITGSLTANSSNGTTGQVLTSNSTGVYWATAASAVTAVRQQYTGDGTTTSFTVSGGYTANSISVFLNGVMLRNGTEVTVTSGTSVVFANAPPSGALIDVIGTLTAGGSGGGSVSVNTIDGGTSTTIFDTVDIIIEGGGA